MAVMAVMTMMAMMTMRAPVTAVAALAALAALTAWQRWHCRGIQDALVCASVDDVAVEEVLDEVPVRYYLPSTEAIVHEVVANVPHPCDEVGAGISARRLPCVKTLITAKPWKPMVSATTSGPTSSHLQNGAAYSISVLSGTCSEGAPRRVPPSLARRRQ